MSLDRIGLRDKLLAMMTDAQRLSWTKEQVAEAMAAAIDGYVRAAVVDGVVVALPDGSPARQSNTAVLR